MCVCIGFEELMVVVLEELFLETAFQCFWFSRKQTFNNSGFNLENKVAVRIIKLALSLC